MLTKTQQKIFDELLKFVNSNKISCAVWGYAGTGKTYLIQQLIPYIKNKVVITAPTHKSLGVISDKFKDYDCFTIHNLLGLAPDVNLKDFNPEVPEFNFICDNKFPSKGIVICDEASMINNELLENLLSFCKRNNSKIIFLGDSSQLPPVKEVRTLVFDESFHSIYKLTEIIRTDNQNIQNYCNQVRSGNLHIPKSCNGIRVIEKEHYKFDDDVILAYSNNTVDDWNIKWKKYHQGTTDIVVGDKLITNRTIKVLTDKLEYRFWEYNGKTYRSDKKEQVVEILPNNTLITIEDFNSTYELISNKGYIFLCDDIETYKERYVYYLEKAKTDKKKWYEFYEFKDNNLLLESITINDQKVNRDLIFAYALTIHKSQGSTYENVAVDYNSIFGNEQQELLYTAITRVSKRLTILV